jgi:hypothetical protein
MGIREILVRIRILASVPLTDVSGMLKNIRIRKIRIRNNGKKSWRSHKTEEIKVFLTIFACVEGSADGSVAGSVLVTAGAECGSGSPQNIRILRIRIPNTVDSNTKKW